MKKLAFVLSVLVLLLAIVPYCLADDCPNEKTTTEQTNEKSAGPGKEAGLCSPFFSCPGCAGFILATLAYKVVFILFSKNQIPDWYKQNLVSSYSAFIWQPPKTTFFFS